MYNYFLIHMCDFSLKLFAGKSTVISGSFSFSSQAEASVCVQMPWCSLWAPCSDLPLQILSLCHGSLLLSPIALASHATPATAIVSAAVKNAQASASHFCCTTASLTATDT